MKKVGKIILYLIIIVIVCAAAGITYIKAALPNVGKAPELKIEITPDRVAKGKYLATHVAVCIDCHSKRDWSKFTAPLDTNTIGEGGEKFDPSLGLPGTIYSPNITPYNLKSWTDGELFRAITTGVRKDGSALFPIMPYLSFSKMDKEDIYDIIAYIRTLPEKKTSYPARVLDFPTSLIVNMIPEKAANAPRPLPGTVEYGKYLTMVAGCFDCHTNQQDGKQIGADLAGGREFQMPNGKLYTANITPDKETGIGAWTRENFITRFKALSDSTHNFPEVSKDGFQTIMPWSMFGGMKSEDLGAIYDYLRTIKPAKNSVTKFVAAK